MKNIVHTRMMALVFLALGLLALCYSCASTAYRAVPTESHSSDSIRIRNDTTFAEFHSLINELRQVVSIRDSIVIQDSVIMVINESGDIVSKETFHARDRNSSRDESLTQIQSKYDSLFQAQRSEINAILSKIQQTPVIMERQLTKWEQLKLDLGAIAIGISLTAICISVIWLIKKIRNRI